MFLISIRTKILISFIGLITFITVILLSVQYNFAYKLAQSAVDKNFHEVSKNIADLIVRSERITKKTLNILSMNSELSYPLDIKKSHPILDDFLYIMHISPSINGIYIGYENDEFYEVINLKNNPILLQYYNAPKDSIWVLLSIIGKEKIKKQYIQFLDKNLKILLTLQSDTSFKVSSRIWHKKATTSDNVIRTDVYKFKSTKEYGITFAKKIPNTDVVIALDFTLNSLNKFLAIQNFDKYSHIILYENNGQKIATSQDVGTYKWSEVFKFFKKHSHDSIHIFSDDGIDYFTYHTLSNFKKDTDLHIGILIPKETLLKPYTEMIKYSIYAAIVFVILIIPLIFYLTSRISNPIRALMKENEKVIDRRFSEVSIVDTNIKELNELSTSFVSMSKSIKKYQKAQERLLDSIIRLIAEAIDAKSTYTGGHCERVPEIAEMLAKVAHDSKEGIFKDFSFNTKDEWKEFHIAAWLHDCGKVTTPEYIIDKATKLETINNRIHEIRTRFEVFFRDAQITYLESQLKGYDKEEGLKKLRSTQEQLLDDFNFIAKANIGGEFMSADKQDRIKEIGKREWIRNFDDRLGLSDVELLRYEGIEPSPTPNLEKLLSNKPEHIIKRENFNYESYKAGGFKDEVPLHLYNYGELYNLCLAKGTLTLEERFKINEHVIMSIKMLEQLPFPEHLTKIPEYAGTHHETMIGTGYPRRLSKEQLSIPARIMAVADIFEALSASDRPYKKAKTLSESIKIMSFMVKDKHIDADLFKLFLESGVYIKYAKKYLKIEQIDEIDISKYI